MSELTPPLRSALRARAHSLHPVVSVSQNGLTPPVVAEIDRCLKAHELIKIRIYGEERAARETLLQQICQALDAAPVQHIGHILVVFRESQEQATEDKPAPRRPRTKKQVANPRRRLAIAKR